MKLSSCHHTELAPEIEPEFIERKWEIETPDKAINISGRIDIQESKAKRRRIRETKTRVAAPPKGMENDMDQLSMYSLASKVLDGEVAPITVDWVVATKTKTYPVSRETTRDHKDWTPLLWRIENAVKGIQSGVFQPAHRSSWWCGPLYCGYWDICPSVNNKRSYFV